MHKSKFLYEEETYKIIGICMEVHRYLGAGFLEIVYKDALEYEFKKAGIQYSREQVYEITYKDEILKHKFYSDFVILDKIIFEIKCSSGFSDADLAQCINYLKVSNLKLALLVNFGQSSLDYRRVIL